MKKALLGLAALVMTLGFTSVPASARGFAVVRRPFYGGGWYSGWYAPYWGPYWAPYGGIYAHPNSGDVKLDTKVKDAQVFINGAYAGTTHDNKTMHLRPGNYNIEIREGGQTQFQQDVYVVAGKTLHLHPEL
jgi:hypothetical protein